MEVVRSRNRGVGASGAQDKEKSLQAHMESFRASVVFDADFDDLFQDEQDLETTHTPINKMEKPKGSSHSPAAVVDDVNFDPFKEIGETRSSFYHGDKDMNLIGGSFEESFGWNSDENQSRAEKPATSKPKKKKGKKEKKEADKFPFQNWEASMKSPVKKGRRSSTSNSSFDLHSASEHSPRKSGFSVTSPVKTPRPVYNRRMSVSNIALSQTCHSTDSMHYTNTPGIARPKWNRRMSMSNLTATESTAFEFGPVTPMRGLKKFTSVSTGLDDSPDRRNRPNWGHRASMSNLYRVTQSDHQGPVSSGFACPITPGRANLNSASAHSMLAAPTFFSPQRQRRGSVGFGAPTLASPKKSPLKMIRRSSVASGLGSSDMMTPRQQFSRRASVGTGLGNTVNTPQLFAQSAHVRSPTRQSPRRVKKANKGGLAMGEEINADSVTKLIKAHLAKQKKEKAKKKPKKKAADKASDSARGSKPKASGKNQQPKASAGDDGSEDLQLLDLDEEDSSSSFAEDDISVHSFGDENGTAENGATLTDARPGLLPRYQSATEDDMLLGMADVTAKEKSSKKQSSDKADDEINAGNVESVVTNYMAKIKDVLNDS